MQIIDYHKTLEEIQADPEGLTAIQYLQSRGLSGYLFPVPFRNSDIEDSPENILARDLSIGATLAEAMSEHLYAMSAANTQHPIELNGVMYQFFAQLTPIPLEMIKLNSEESKVFVDAINNPPAASENLQKAASNYFDPDKVVH